MGGRIGRNDEQRSENGDGVAAVHGTGGAGGVKVENQKGGNTDTVPTAKPTTLGGR